MLDKNNSPLKYGIAQDDEFTNLLGTINVTENMNQSPMKSSPMKSKVGGFFNKLVSGGGGAGGGMFGPAGMAIGAAASLGMGIWGAIKGRNAARKAREKEDEARAQMDKLKEAYSNLDTSNPFMNMENTMEDLTINQKQAEFQKQQFEQSQSNIMSGLRGAAGGSGIAALAQSLAQQGQLQSQQAAASIGQQEAANQRLAAQEASRIQGMERQGDVMSRNWEKDKVGTLLGMSQQETAAYAQQAAEADAQGWNALSTGVGGATGMITAGFQGSGSSGGSSDDLLKALLAAKK